MGSTVLTRRDAVFLFDLDGTLTESRQAISPHLYDYLVKEVKQKVKIGIVGGSDLVKIVEQLGNDEKALKDFDYVFAENGLVAYIDGELKATQSLSKVIGEDQLQEFINYALGYLSKLKLPLKRGNFIELRNGMINICPVGRSCSQEERIQFYEYDKVHKIRDQMVNDLRKQFAHTSLQFSIGGQISIDVFPKGWDKTYSLNFFKDAPTVIHFFGDKTSPGGNDYEIFADERTIGHTVTGPDNTESIMRQLLSS